MILLFLNSLFLTDLLLNLNFNQKTNEINKIERLHESQVIDHPDILWIENPTFEGIGIPWYSSIEGDFRDVDASVNSNQANFEILGDIRTFSEISGTPNGGEWVKVNHSVRPLPLTHEINQNGLNVSHVYDEDSSGPFPNSGDQTANLAGVLWKRNITLQADMSDYIITSAILNSIVNGTGDTNLETPPDRDYLYTNYPPPNGYASLYDYARFFIEISDITNIESYEIASYKTLNLGEGNQTRRGYGTTNDMSDTNMTIIDEDVLIYTLTQVLKHDNHNFTITLGIEIDCEDNYLNYELDVWYSLLIKSCDLTFTYVKKMDQLTFISWNQVGNDIDGTNVKVTNGNLKFKYKIDQQWPTSSSPNSEIRILINNRQHSESIRLELANSSFQEAKIDGYDITNIVYPYENVTLSIQVFLADEFGLNQSIIVSITDVYLYISYTETFPEITLEPWIFTTLLIVASIIATGVGSYLVAYQKVLKYPRPVRKVRKFKRTLRRKRTPNVVIFNREKAFRRIYSREISGSIKLPKTKLLESTLPEKLGAESVKPTMEPEELIEKSIEKKAELDKLVKNSAEEASKK